MSYMVQWLRFKRKLNAPESTPQPLDNEKRGNYNTGLVSQFMLNNKFRDVWKIYTLLEVVFPEVKKLCWIPQGSHCTFHLVLYRSMQWFWNKMRFFFVCTCCSATPGWSPIYGCSYWGVTASTEASSPSSFCSPPSNIGALCPLCSFLSSFLYWKYLIVLKKTGPCWQLFWGESIQ